MPGGGIRQSRLSPYRPEKVRVVLDGTMVMAMFTAADMILDDSRIMLILILTLMLLLMATTMTMVMCMMMLMMIMMTMPMTTMMMMMMQLPRRDDDNHEEADV